MFGQKPAFGSTPTGFGGSTFNTTNTASPFGAASTSFGQPQQQPAFGSTAFGSTPTTSGSLFGTTSSAQGSSLFGTTGTTNSFGGFGGGSAFGVSSSAFKPASTFGASATPTFGSTSVSTGGGLFGPTATQPTGGLFSSAPQQQTSAFGASPFGSAATGFGQQVPVGTTVKFNPPTGTDTIMKSGGHQNINTRHQCITCMKEYEAKSLEELRFEDYAANRKGAGNATTGGLFGATPAATVTASGGIFGSQPQQAGLFGQQNKPLFGAGSTSAFGAVSTATPFSNAATGFGQPSTSMAGSGLFGNKPTGFGTTPTSTGFGFGQTPAQPTTSGLFGQQPKPFGTASPQQNPVAGGLFGSNTPAFGAPSTAFGQTSGFNQPAPNQQIGLFGQQTNKPAGFGAFGSPASTASSFGFGNTLTQANSFGQTTKPTFGFGTAPQTSAPAFGAPATSTSAFSSTQATPAGSLFAPKPSFSFGSSTTQASNGFGGMGNTFGSTVGTGGLFGTNAPKPGGMFGSTGPTSFGASVNPTPFASGAPSSTGFNFTGTGSSFGGYPLNNASMSTPLSFNTANFGSSGYGAQPQQLSQIQVQSQPPLIHQQLEMLTQNPYGDNPLFQHLLPDLKKREDLLKPTSPAAQKALGANSYKVSLHRNVKIKPKPISAGLNKSNMFDGLEEDELNASKDDVFVPRTSVKKLILRPKVSSQEQSSSSLNRSMEDPSNSHHTFDDTLADGEKPDESLFLNTVKDKIPLNVKDSNEAGKGPDPDDSIVPFISRKKTSMSTGSSSNTPNASGSAANASYIEKSKRSLNETGLQSEDNDIAAPEHPAGIVLKRAGYYTIPELSEISNMVDKEGNCFVENFTIGRTGYGNIFFPGVTNVRDMNFDDIVFFRRKEVIVYPDDDNKPPPGEGLNRRAQVTLDKVWPIDKNAHEAITSPDRLINMNYEEKLQKACIKLGARFIEYRPETGSWVFKVDHFSKYGLDDSDEEDDTVSVKKLDKKVKVQISTKGKVAGSNEHQRQQDTASKDLLGLTKASVHAEIALPDLDPCLLAADQGVEVNSSCGDADTSYDRLPTRSKMQLMKSAFFHSDEDEDMGASVSLAVNKTTAVARSTLLEARPTILERRDKLIEDIAHSVLSGNPSKGLGGKFSLDPSSPLTSSILLRTQYLDHSKSSSLLDSTLQPSRKKSSKLSRYTLQAGYDKYVPVPNTVGLTAVQPVVPQHVDQFLPLAEAIMSGDQLKNVADAALFMSRRFRVGWGPNWSLTTIGGSSLHVNFEVCTVQSYGPFDDDQLSSLDSWLEASLECCQLSLDSQGIPYSTYLPGQSSLDAFAREAARQLELFSSTDNVEFAGYLSECHNVWSLCLALWGQLPALDAEGQADQHEVCIQRKKAVSNWLTKVVSGKVEADLQKARLDGDAIDQARALMCGNKLQEACDAVQSDHDHYAVMLLSQTSGNNSIIGQLVMRQLDAWHDSKADQVIDQNRLAMLYVVAGVPLWPNTEDTCKGLDWLRAFGLHLWYLTSPVASIGDALEAYDAAFQGATSCGVYAVPPYPDCAADGRHGSSGEVFDIKYSLLKLFSNRRHMIENIILPASYTPDSLDHRLGWFVAIVLSTLGYGHMSTVHKSQHHLEFAAQLEAVEMWHWAVFVLLHLEEPELRQHKIKEVLVRHVQLDDASGIKESFLLERLLIPKVWLAEAKAIKAAILGNYGDQAWYLIQAEMWNEAHEVTMTKIAPDAIINEDYDFFFGLISDMAPSEINCHIKNWCNGGQLLYDFIQIDMEIRDLLRSRNESTLGLSIQKLRPRVLRLCSRVSSMTVTSAKERLCQSEISKKVAYLLRAVLSLQGHDDGTSQILADQLSQLPLPDDYDLQELRTLSRICMRERMTR